MRKYSKWIRVSSKGLQIYVHENHIMKLSLIRTTWSLKFFDVMPLVKGSTIINSVLMWSVVTFYSLTHSFMAKYLMSMYLLWLPLLLFLAMKITAELSQYNLNDLEMKSTTLSPNMKHFNYTSCKVASKHDTNLVSTVEVAVKVCFVLLQDTASPTSIKI